MRRRPPQYPRLLSSRPRAGAAPGRKLYGRAFLASLLLRPRAPTPRGRTRARGLGAVWRARGWPTPASAPAAALAGGPSPLTPGPGHAPPPAAVPAPAIVPAPCRRRPRAQALRAGVPRLTALAPACPHSPGAREGQGPRGSVEGPRVAHPGLRPARGTCRRAEPLDAGPGACAAAARRPPARFEPGPTRPRPRARAPRAAIRRARPTACAPACLHPRGARGPGA